MKRAREVWIIAALTLGLACTDCARQRSIAVKGPADRTEAAAQAVCELAVRYAAADLREDQSVFVAFRAAGGEASDPPAGFLDRLTDLPHTFEPRSAYPGDLRRHPVLVVVDAPEWVGQAEARVRVTQIRFGVGGADGFIAKVEWQAGRWLVNGAVQQWST